MEHAVLRRFRRRLFFMPLRERVNDILVSRAASGEVVHFPEASEVSAALWRLVWAGLVTNDTSPRYVPCWQAGRVRIRCGPPLPWRARYAGAVPHDCLRRVLLRVLIRAGIAAWAAPVPALLIRRFRPGFRAVQSY